MKDRQCLSLYNLTMIHNTRNQNKSLINIANNGKLMWLLPISYTIQHINSTFMVLPGQKQRLGWNWGQLCIRAQSIVKTSIGRPIGWWTYRFRLKLMNKDYSNQTHLMLIKLTVILLLRGSSSPNRRTVFNDKEDESAKPTKQYISVCKKIINHLQDINNITTNIFWQLIELRVSYLTAR